MKARSVQQKKYNSQPEQMKFNASRKRARRLLIKAGVNVKGKDVDHKDHNPMNNKLSNLRVREVSKNRADNKRK